MMWPAWNLGIINLLDKLDEIQWNVTIEFLFLMKLQHNILLIDIQNTMNLKI